MDYLAFGAARILFSPSPSTRAPLAMLGEAQRRFGLLVAAIGGITLDNAAPVVAAGGSAAVIS